MLLLASALALAGCATPAPDTGTPWQRGRLALRVDALAGRAAQSLNVAFELRGDGERGELHLISPIGTQLAAARWAPGLAELRSSEGEKRYASLDALSREALGEALPLAALPDWLAGRPWRGAAHTAQDGGFEQLGWAIDTRGLAEGRVLARRPTSAAAAGVNLRVQLDPDA
jgi:outer membrane lipoprotein LolB